MSARKRKPVLDLAPSAGFEQDHAAVVADLMNNDLSTHSRETAREVCKEQEASWRVVGLGVRLDLARICVNITKARLEGKKE